jgi:hypothetical protein
MLGSVLAMAVARGDLTARVASKAVGTGVLISFSLSKTGADNAPKRQR